MQTEFISVRKDILVDLYNAIDEFSEQIYTKHPDDWRFGNVMELRAELEVGRRYSEKSSSEKTI
jgi:hypothetical protein